MNSRIKGVAGAISGVGVYTLVPSKSYLFLTVMIT